MYLVSVMYSKEENKKTVSDKLNFRMIVFAAGEAPGIFYR